MELNDLKVNGVSYDWLTVFTGVSERLLINKTIVDYAVEELVRGEESEFLLELAWGIDDDQIEELLARIKSRYLLQSLTENNYEIVKRKLRLCWLLKQQAEQASTEELLKRVEEYYSDHDYPEDMAALISYMPQTGKSSTGDLKQRLEDFIQSEKIFLKEESGK